MIIPSWIQVGPLFRELRYIAQGQLRIYHYHLLRNLILVALSLLFLPIDTGILLISYSLSSFYSHPRRRQCRSAVAFHPKNILVTGVGMEKGLFLARTFYQAGHDVIGADFEPYGLPVRGRMSCALKKFYRLSQPDPIAGPDLYIRDLLAVVRRENVDLWVNCAGVASAAEEAQAKEIIEQYTGVKAIQFGVVLTETLHAKNTFIDYTASLGLNVPETHLVTQQTAVHEILNSAPEGRSYIIKPVGVNESLRGAMTLLSRSNSSHTYRYVSGLDISPDSPWVLQQFISGKEYCTHALIVKGKVKAFVACPSTSLLMYYEPLPSASALNRAMLKFTQEFASRTGHTMTGHLSFDMMVEERSSANKGEMTIYPIECNPRTHTAVVLLDGKSQQLAEAYLSTLDPDSHSIINGCTTDSNDNHIVTAQESRKFYWIGHDIVTLLFLPIFQLMTSGTSVRNVVNDSRNLLRHLLFWSEGTYTLWDPLPWWWLYHIYWPGRFLIAIWYRAWWTQANISTTKLFPLMDSQEGSSY